MLATFDAELVVVNGTRRFVFQPDSWVARMQELDVIHDDNVWSWSFFGAFTQMLAISIGLQEPLRDVEMWGCFVSILAGSFIYGLFVAALTTAVSESDYSAKEYRSRLNMVNEYMRYAELPRDLRKRLRSFYELVYPSKRAFNETDILEGLTKPLRAKVALHKCRNVLEALRLVTADEVTGGMAGNAKKMTFLAEAISLNLRRVVYVDGDYIIRQDEDSEGMYFISTGFAEVLNEDETVLTTLGKGSFFGEMSLLQPEGRSVASVRAATYCDGYFLSRLDFERLSTTYPTLRETISTVAKLRKIETLRRNSLSQDGGMGACMGPGGPGAGKSAQVLAKANKGSSNPDAAAARDKRARDLPKPVKV